MPVYFENESLRVSQGWLGGWKIHVIATRSTFIPNFEQKLRIGFVWRAVRSDPAKMIAPSVRQAEDVMFEIFAVSVMQPLGDVASAFLSGTAEQCAANIAHEASIRDAASRL